MGVAGIVEASPRFAQKHSMLLARVLTQPGSGDLVPVRVVNPSPTPVTLYRHTHLGTFTEVDKNPVCRTDESMHVLNVGEVPRRPGTASELFDLETGELTQPEKGKVRKLLKEFQNIFSKEPNDLDRTSKVQLQGTGRTDREVVGTARGVRLHT